MTDNAQDKIIIRGLRAKAIIGIHPHEKRERQDVLIDIELDLDLTRPGITDDIDDTIDYQALQMRVLRATETSSCNLIENLAETIAAICLEDTKAESVRITVDKPAASEHAESVAVVITRTQKEI